MIIMRLEVLSLFFVKIS